MKELGDGLLNLKFYKLFQKDIVSHGRSKRRVRAIGLDMSALNIDLLTFSGGSEDH